MGRSFGNWSRWDTSTCVLGNWRDVEEGRRGSGGLDSGYAGSERFKIQRSSIEFKGVDRRAGKKS